MTKSAYDRFIRIQPGEQRGIQGSERNGLALMTMEEVATKMKISRQAVHQIERKALAKLRRAFALEWRLFKGGSQ